MKDQNDPRNQQSLFEEGGVVPHTPHRIDPSTVISTKPYLAWNREIEHLKAVIATLKSRLAIARANIEALRKIVDSRRR